jgi:hypothetical protein
MFNEKLVAILFGITFAAVGILGFVENPIASGVGFFQANRAHNLVHLLTAVILFAGIAKFHGHEKQVVLYTGYFYGLFAILGFVWPGDMLLGFIHINEADRWLHVLLALAIMVAGFLTNPQQAKLRAQYN